MIDMHFGYRVTFTLRRKFSPSYVNQQLNHQRNPIMSLSPRTGTPNHTSLRVRFFAFACVLSLLATQFVLPAKAVVFASGRAITPPPISAPPEPFVVGSNGAETRLLRSVPSVTGMLASLARSFTLAFPPSGGVDEKSNALAGEVDSSSTAVAAPAMFLPSASAFDLAKLRLDPKNATGGTDLYSQNFGWGTSLVGLPGRAGLDMGFGISYNSLVWLKDAAHSEIVFDPDVSKVSPGFTFGFPDIEPAYYDTDKSVWVFLMLNPDGSRTEFRRVGSSDVFDSADSSYRQLVINPGGAPDGKAALIDMTVTSTDGTRMHYLWKSQIKKYQCEEIKDRNGNYITINYTSGRMTSLADTLGRVITINYDSGNYPISITQTWKDGNGGGSTNVTHNWATFDYTNATVSTSFSGLTVIGPANSTTVKVLEKITYPDSSFTKFEYNGYIQVKKISQVAADSTSHVLNYVSTNLDTISGSPTDCPRLSTTRSWVENFNLVSGTATEVVATNSLTTGATYSLPNSISGSATRIDVAVTGHPDGLYTRTYVGASGYKESLPLATEDCTGTNCATRLRWTWTDWTQDNTGVSYITNPRVVESRVGDGTNTKKTTVGYGSNGYGLSELVKVYDTDLSTVLKTQTTAYQLGSTYTDKRIIGLPSETKLYEGTDSSGTLMSKVTYAYDEGNLTGTDPVQNISPTQHDNTNFSSSYVTGRGLLTSMTRWDATAPTTSGSAVTSSMKYNTAGAVVSKTDSLSHTVKVAYADNYNSSPGISTYAYPTTLTDQAGNSSTVKYRYDIGANVEANSPAPAGQTYGKTSKRWFDSYGRMEKEAVLVNGVEQFYTRREFPTNGIQSKTYSTIIDTGTNGPDTADEVLSESWSDGAGRVRLARTPHTFDSYGAAATWAGSQIEYDILGRVKRQSVPTEVDSSFNPTGDDYSRGWLWTYEKYDWKGRTVRKINTDGTDSSTLNDSDILISYEGCGCAGGQVTTIEGERVPYGTSSYARRKQKVYEDILGREVKTESFEWDGSTVYSTVANQYNGRDQVIQTTEYAGTTSSSTHQETTASYDGFGRLKQSHKPEQRDGSTLKYTSYNYNADDSIQTVTDARGAETEYTYNNRGLVTNIAWHVGSTGITDPTDVTFSYDNLGNRTQMTDGLGQVDYQYDSLSRMTAETRDFTDSLVNAPVYGVYKLEYTYTMSGLKSYKDPFGETISYTPDKLGRVSSVASTWSSGSRTYANNPHYRTWGALTHLDYGNGTEMNAGGFNNRLQATTFEVKKGTTSIINKTYDFYSDSSVKSETDANDARFDRLYKYDHQARITNAYSGAEARGSTDSAVNIPFGNTFGYDAFSHQNSIYQKHFAMVPTSGWTYNYANNRLSDTYYANFYDYQGNQVRDIDAVTKTYDYDAADRMSSSYFYYVNPTTSVIDFEDYETMSYSGDNQLVKVATTHDPTEGDTETDATYQIRSSVLGGQTISKVDKTGAKIQTYIIAAGTVVAGTFWDNSAVWSHKDPNTDSIRSTTASGTVSWSDSDFGSHELDASGRSVGFSNPYGSDPQWDNIPDLYQAQQSFDNMTSGMPTSFKVDGLQMPKQYFEEYSEFLGENLFLMIKHNAWLSTHPIGYKKIDQPRTPPTLKPSGAGETIPPGADAYADFDERGESTRNYYKAVYASSWTANLIISPFLASVLALGKATWKNRFTPEEIASLRKHVGDAITGDCADFLARILKAHTGRDIDPKAFLLEGFDRVRDSGPKYGFFWGGLSAFPGTGGVSGWGNRGKNDAEIDYGHNGKTSSEDFQTNIAGFIHEIVHVAAFADDKALSEAVLNAGITVYTARGEIMDFPTDKDNRNLKYSGYWGQALINHCAPK